MESEIITLDVTVEEYQQDLASGLRQDEVLEPGRHRFKRGGFLARHALQGEDAATSAGKVRILAKRNKPHTRRRRPSPPCPLSQ